MDELGYADDIGHAVHFQLDFRTATRIHPASAFVVFFSFFCHFSFSFIFAVEGKLSDLQIGLVEKKNHLKEIDFELHQPIEMKLRFKLESNLVQVMSFQSL